MDETIEALRDGDVYRWYFRDMKDGGIYGHHCCSNIGIVHNGLLRDTYWQIGQSFSDGRTFGADDLPKLNLTRLGNLDALEKAREWQVDYYDDADIVNLNHPNSTSGNFYLRKGAKRSQEKMLAVARQRFAEAEADFHTARRRMDEIGKSIDQISVGATDLFIASWRRA